jgi:hypothetical protein
MRGRVKNLELRTGQGKQVSLKELRSMQNGRRDPSNWQPGVGQPVRGYPIARFLGHQFFMLCAVPGTSLHSILPGAGCINRDGPPAMRGIYSRTATGHAAWERDRARRNSATGCDRHRPWQSRTARHHCAGQPGSGHIARHSRDCRTPANGLPQASPARRRRCTSRNSPLPEVSAGERASRCWRFSRLEKSKDKPQPAHLSAVRRLCVRFF